jgi:hypothetical protein
MDILKLLRSLNNKYLLQLVYSVIGLALILGVGACKNHHIGETTDSIGNLKMSITKTLLIGNEKKIKAVFKLEKEEFPVLLSDFKLKVSMLDQETFSGTTTGSKIAHQLSFNERKDFSGNFEKGLNEFTTLSELGATPEQNELTVDFDLLPSHEAIKVKLLFELLDEKGKPIQTQEVKWIRDAVLINSPAIFEGKRTLITLKSLEKDIKDLSTIIVRLKSDEEKVHFYFKANGQSVATLSDLLGNSSKIFGEIATSPIEIVVDTEDKIYGAKVTVIVFDTHAIDDSHPLGKREIHWHSRKLSQEGDQDQEFLKREQQRQGNKQGASQSRQQQESKGGATEDPVKEEPKTEQQGPGSKQEPTQPQQQADSRGRETVNEDPIGEHQRQGGSSKQKDSGLPAKDSETASTSVEQENISDPAMEIRQEVEKIKKAQEKEQNDKQELEQLRQQEKILEEGISQGGKEDKQAYQQGRTDKQALDQLKQREEVLAKDIEEIDNILKEEEKEVKKKKKNRLKALKKREKKELKGTKSEAEKHTIRETYSKRKQAVKLAAEAAEVDLKHKRDHSKGFMNALAHNMIGVPLKTPKNEMYRLGQVAGHRAAVVLGRTETALGGTLTSVGVATLVAGTGPTLGGAAIGSAALIGVGLFGVAHGIAAAERAQANLAKLKDTSSDKSDTSHETSHHVHIEDHDTEQGASAKVKVSSEEK